MPASLQSFSVCYFVCLGQCKAVSGKTPMIPGLKVQTMDMLVIMVYVTVEKLSWFLCN